MKESQRIKPIIPFADEHIPEVTGLFRRILLADSSTRRLQPLTGLEEYFREIFFRNPWYDESLPSWVYRSSDGRIAGFIGIVPRRMKFQGETIRVAVSFHFMVDPAYRSSMAGVQLLKHFFSGPQHLSVTDGAGDAGRIVWEGVGGTTAHLYSLQFTKVLKPASNGAKLLESRSGFRHLLVPLRPLIGLADIAASKFAPRIYSPAADIKCEEELTPESLIASIGSFHQKRSVLPDYDASSLNWLFEHLGLMKYYGDLRSVMVRGENGEPLGTFIYYSQRGGIGTVIQCLARKDETSRVLDHLFSHARRNGSIALRGRLDPRMMQDFSDRRCTFDRNGAWVLIHSREKAIVDAFRTGDAFFTGLEGEFGLLF